MGARGRHIGNHGNLRVQDALDHVAHGIRQAARRVECQHEERRLLLVGARECAQEELAGRGTDRVLDLDQDGGPSQWRGLRRGGVRVFAIRGLRRRHAERCTSHKDCQQAGYQVT